MQELSFEQIQEVSGGMVVDLDNIPPGVIVDQYGNAWTKFGHIPLFNVVS
jgi:hypothetical protein